MTSRKSQAIVGILFLLSGALLLVAQAKGLYSGQWMIEPCNDKTGTLQLTLRYNERGDQERNDGWGWWGNSSRTPSASKCSTA